MTKVFAREERIIIPTYGTGKPNRNPMFLEKRVYQGSSGVVYPHPVIDKINDNKENREYDVVFLENKYLKIMIMPSLGGRVHMACDKTNGHNFIYYNQVIKPALVGLTGPWISGGIEFNWPQHHRPSTFEPVDHTICENPDGSCTVWVSEIELMFRTKGMVGFTLYPEKSYLELKVKLYNRTSEPQTFLWWANPALAVNDDYQSVFPPDVHAVMDHGKRDVSRFPIATGEYYKVDYSPGIDISRYKNIPVPTSYMAYKSEYNFVGGYDHGKKAGMLHVCNHYISPGKKQWVWGNGDFGKAWDRNLTDEDGPYVELMTGVYTDNQPDFSWLQPYEQKSFTQYFMPYKKIGYVKNASKDIAVSLDIDNGKAVIGIYTTGEEKDLTVKLTGSDGQEFLKKVIASSPEKPFTAKVKLGSIEPQTAVKLAVYRADGTEMIAYTASNDKLEEFPEPAREAAAPEAINTIEELFLTGQHVEQYRHATRLPEDYYREGLKRDNSDVRCNNALGLLLYRRGRFAEAEKHFKAAVKKQTYRNPNPYDGEPRYNLGLALKMQGKKHEAFEAFYKAVWNDATQGCGYFQLALLAAESQDFEQALDCIERSLIKNWHNHKGRNLKTAVLRRMGRFEEAQYEAELTAKLDILDFGSRNEMIKLLELQGENDRAGTELVHLTKIMRDNDNNYLELSLDYMQAGLYDEAIEILLRLLTRVGTDKCSPLITYHLAWYHQLAGDTRKAALLFKKAALTSPDYCFPNKLESILALQAASRTNPTDSKAAYYLGNLWYGFRQYDLAIDNWEKSVKLYNNFPTVHRNLGLAYMNKCNNSELCRYHLSKAFELDKTDARILFEYDQYLKKENHPLLYRLALLEEYFEVVKQRDDLYLEYITLINQLGNHKRALDLITQRKFHPWEGGEGKVPQQYKYSLTEMAKEAIRTKKYDKAVELLERCKNYPENLGEGKLYGTQENNINYHLGIAYEGLGKKTLMRKAFEAAAVGLAEPSSAMYYNDQPPEMIFYQGLALIKLGKTDEAHSRFNKLIDYGEKHIFDDCEIDYFAVSLPDFLVFDVDMNEKNKIHCRYMMALGHMGLGNTTKAAAELSEVLTLDSSHLGALTHRDMNAQ
ncbi:DUF5107 domain-containing protein [Lentisphaerota bacterium ZTH]|nr:DUF5107 domain-containing protein [Lentisphaerota bacterium]WET07299.1 DUF5107 domain-containing protein [Lentisphaerota bacterium ZTH]